VKTKVLPPIPTPVAEFIQHIAALLPAAESVPEPGGVEARNWWVEIKLGQRAVAVEWRPKRGFGVYAVDGQTYGEGPREIILGAFKAAQRLVQFLSQ
jgi:hypothetical protein